MYRTPAASRAWTKLGSTDQLEPMPRRVTVWPVLPRVIVGTPAVAASAGPAAARAGPAAAATLRKRRRLPPQEPCEPSIVATFQNERGSDRSARTRSPHAGEETSRIVRYSDRAVGGWSTRF